VLRSLRPIVGQHVSEYTVRGQYSPGVVNGEEVPGYRREPGVKPDSTVETFVALKAYIDNWRWAGVPFYLRTGKRMTKRVTEIAVQFREIPPVLFNAPPSTPLEPNVLALRIQPEEGFSLHINSKQPGSRVRIEPVAMDFRYGSGYGTVSPEAYERLLLDVMAGDATLFMRRDAVEAAAGALRGGGIFCAYLPPPPGARARGGRRSSGPPRPRRCPRTRPRCSPGR